MLPHPVSIGSFPEYLLPVKDLINKAGSGSKVDIYQDSPDHGSLADFELHFQVRNAVKEAARRNAEVRMLLPHEFARISRANPQFEYSQNFRRFKETPGFKEFFEAEYAWFTEAQSPEEMDPCIDAYMNFALKDFVDAHVHAARLPKDAEPFPFLMWKVDVEVIYVPLNQVPYQAAEAHRTSGTQNIEIFAEVFMKRWKTATPVGRDIATTR